jgi:hypothetical protein
MVRSMRIARPIAFAACVAGALLAQDTAWEAIIRPSRPLPAWNESLVISSGGHRLQSFQSPVADVMTFC